MTSILDPIIQGFFAASATVITGVIALYVPRGIEAFEARTGVQLTDQERAAVLSAAQTEAGIIETRLQQGTLKLADVKTDSDAMLDHANAALARVPDSASTQGAGGSPLTPSAMAALIVGRVQTTPIPPVIVVPATTGAPA